MTKFKNILIIVALIAIIASNIYGWYQYHKAKQRLQAIQNELTIALKSTVELDSIKIEIAKLYTELALSSELRRAYQKKLLEFKDKHKDLFDPPKVGKIVLDTNLIRDLERHRNYKFLSDSIHEDN